MRKYVWVVIVCVGALWAVPAEAQNGGIRAGASFHPNQFYFGVHGQVGPVVDLIDFRPNLEIGFGDRRTVVALNGEFVYPFELRNGTPLYAGGGPALVIIRRDRANQPGSDNNVEPGFNFLLGVLLDEHYFAELKVGLIDSPEVKIGFGYNF